MPLGIADEHFTSMNSISYKTSRIISVNKGIRQFAVFLCVGGFSTGIQYVTLWILVAYVSVNAILSSAIGFVLSALVNYLLNYYLTFQSNVRHRFAITNFFLVALVGLIINTIIMEILIDTVKIHYMIAQIVATVSVLFWNFYANKKWTF